jgi:GNAT superfamily N-acetyltransferase
MPAPDIIISRAQLSDAPEILDLQKLAYLSEAEIYDDYGLPPLTQTLEELRAEMGEAVCLKAVQEGRILGSVRARQKDGVCFIGRLIVEPAWQGRGLGRRLMAAMEAEFSQARRYELFTGSLSARNLSIYEKLGYQPFKTQELSPGLSLVFLAKPGQA